VGSLTPQLLDAVCPELTEGTTALFDIDSTIMDTAPRNMQILREVGEAWPELKPAVERIQPSDIGWNIFAPLEVHTSLDRKTREAIDQFWKERFFTDEYVLYDHPYSGVRELLYRLRERGVRLVYLTGRDEPNMSRGTRDSFAQHDLPLDRETRLIFKPTFEEADLTFKRRVCDQLAREERIVLAVENEPGNANLMNRSFPGVLVALIDTVTSPNPPTPDPEILRFSRYGD
jgi:hypothetical protein